MMKFIVSLFTFLVFIPALYSSVSAQSPSPMPLEERQVAVVSKVLEEKDVSDSGVKRKYQKLELVGFGGKLDGKKVLVENGKIPIINTVEYDEGDKVVLSITKGSDGKDAYFITDHVRTDSLLWLFGIFNINF